MTKNQNTKPNANAVGGDASHACDVCNSHRSNSYSNIDPHSKGITLVALIITIIVMLILVAVSITIAINGGLFDTTKKAAKGTEKAKKAEQELASGRVKIDGTWYDSLEDYAIGKASNIQGIVDLDESNTKIKYTPEGWTSEKVKVGIDSVAVSTEFILKYSTDNINWNDYTGEITVSSNGAIYAKLVDSDGNEGEAITANVSNIDKDAPIINTHIAKAGEETDVSIPLSINVTDSVSGISKIKWYYKSETENKFKEDVYVTMNGKEAGERGKVTKEAILTGLKPETTYNIYAEVYDVAGNVARSPETGTIDITTLAKKSYLGKSATIDGKKFIVLYDPGEVGEGAELISADVLEAGKITVGYGAIGNLKQDVSTGIYKYNDAIRSLNSTCASLIDSNTHGLLDVRSVGSKPGDKNYENTTLYTNSKLTTYPNRSPGLYNKKLKSGDTNYLSDYNRMVELGIVSGSPNNVQYWLASREVRDSSSVSFYVRFVVNGSVSPRETVHVDMNDDRTYDNSYGVRPIIMIDEAYLSQYLDS